MFTSQEKNNLNKLIAHAVNEDDVLSFNELHGFLCGLTIIPEKIVYSEWLPDVFGKEMLKFDNEKEEEKLLENLFIAYDRITNLNRDAVSIFPFNYDTIKANDFEHVREWAHGFYMSISLRPKIWGIDDGEESTNREFEVDQMEDNCDENLKIGRCFDILIGVASPEYIPQLFTNDKNEPNTLDFNDPELDSKLLFLLPYVVETLRKFGSLQHDVIQLNTLIILVSDIQKYENMTALEWSETYKMKK
jgi:yecA family protein